MWKKLNTEIDVNQDCYFAVLGGDQVYMDETFNDEIKTFKNGTTVDKNSITWNESQTNLMLKELILNSKEYGGFLVTTNIAHSFYRCEN